MSCGWCGAALARTASTCPRCGRSPRGYEDQLIGAVRHGHGEARTRVIQLLGQVGSDRALAAFEELLHGDLDQATARAIVRATMAIGGPGARRLLDEAAHHRSPLVRQLVETLAQPLGSP